MSMRTDRLRMLGCIGFLLIYSFAAMATETVEPSPTDFSTLHREITENIGRLEDQVAAQKLARSGLAATLLDELALWRQIELVVAQRKTVFDLAQLAPPSSGASDTVAGEISQFLQLEDARNALAVLEDNLESLTSELQDEHSLMLEIKELVQQAEQDRRRTTENLLGASVGSRDQLQTQQRLDALRVRLYQQQLSLHRDTIAEISQRRDRVELIIAGYRDRIVRAGYDLRLSKAELRQQLAKIADMEEMVHGQLSQLDQQTHLILVASSAEQGATPNNLGVIREESQLLRQLLSETAAIRECWKRRYLVSNQDPSTDEWMKWRDDARQAEERLSQIDLRLASRTTQRRQQVDAIQRQSLQNGQATEDRSSEIEQLEAIIDAYGKLQVLAANARRTYSRFAEDLDARLGRNSVAVWRSWAGDRFSSFWEYELTAVDDRSVTVGKLVVAFWLLIIGLIVSKVITSIVAFRVLPRFGFSHPAALTIRQIMMYGMIVAMTMLSLKMVNVPLTIFAFLGGAAAIGVGFGSQNTVANFISGLILLIQRPIRIGDLVNVDGIDANVEHIGARATRVKTSENLEVLIPNNNILHNKVTNWTLSDTRIRTSVSVGVAYGTAVQPVVDVLQRVVAQHSKVVQEPSPIVLFDDFGDSSLVFSVHFWIHMQTIMERDQVRSGIRLAIDDAFRQAGIVIAFPQRDVHLDVTSPIEVSMSDSQSSAAPSETGRLTKNSKVHLER